MKSYSCDDPDILSLFKGICRAETVDGWLLPIRMTEKQEAFFAAQGEGMAMRAKCSAGIRLDFFTTDLSVDFDFKTGVAYRKTVAFDLYVNDVLCDSYPIDESGTGHVSWHLSDYDVSFLTPTEKRRVTIHFPCIAQVFIRGLTLRMAEPTEERPFHKILFFGDSITQGVDCGNHASLNMPALTARYLQSDFVNLGVGSAVFCPGFIDKAHPFAPDEIVVAYGANDCSLNVSEAELKENIPGFFEILKETYPSVPVFALSPIWSWRADDTGSKSLSDAEKMRAARVRELIRFSCKKFRYHYPDGMELTPHISSFFRPDDPHPAEIGFTVFGAELAEKIRANRR